MFGFDVNVVSELVSDECSRSKKK